MRLSLEFEFLWHGWLKLSLKSYAFWRGQVNLWFGFWLFGRGWMRLSLEVCLFWRGWMMLSLELALLASLDEGFRWSFSFCGMPGWSFRRVLWLLAWHHPYVSWKMRIGFCPKEKDLFLKPITTLKKLSIIKKRIMAWEFLYFKRKACILGISIWIKFI